jgi:hypothetical protein
MSNKLFLAFGTSLYLICMSPEELHLFKLAQRLPTVLSPIRMILLEEFVDDLGL